MTYKEFKDAEQEEFNKLPVFFAFSDTQFEKALNERGLTLADTCKVARLGDTGGFFLKEDRDKIQEFFNRPNKLLELMKDPEFARDAFLSEMRNHEYHINWEADYDVCSCFGHCKYEDGKGGLSYLKEMGYGTETLVAYQEAREQFYREVDENGWD